MSERDITHKKEEGNPANIIELLFTPFPASAFIKVQLKFHSTHHEELAESDMGENVVGFVFATSDPALLPEVGELVL